MVDNLMVLEFSWKKCGKIIGLVMETATIRETLENISR